MRVADYIAQRIAATGTECVFMVAGGMAMHLNDAFGRITSWKYYCSHHEQASAMSADAYARATGKLGVCMVTSGPGATNVLTGLVGAYQDSVPVIFLSGQCKRVETIQGQKIKGLRQAGFLEVDIVPIVEPVTKYAAFLDDPATVAYHVDKAIDLALSGRPGPVLLDIPLDVQGAQMPEQTLVYQRESGEKLVASSTDIEAVLGRLARAKRPLILAGHGIRTAGAVEAFRQFVESTKIPVVTTMMAKDLMRYEHPQFVGHCGPRAERAANFAVQAADVIVCMGSSLHVQTIGYETDLFAPNAFKIEIDIDAPILERHSKIVQAHYQWDIGEYVPEFARRSVSSEFEAPQEWSAACQLWKRKYSVHTEEHSLGEAGDRVNLYEFVEVLSDLLQGDETILTDAGQPHPILGQTFRIKGNQRYLNPGSLAEMGYALPAAFGPAAAPGSGQVIAVTGDGSLQTNIHELQTLKHYQFNVKLFVVNNEGYGSIRKTQENFFQSFYVGATVESGISFPDTRKICEAYGLDYVRCNNRGELERVVGEVLSCPGPTVCELMAQTNQRIMPVVPSRLMPDGRMKSKGLDEMAPEMDIDLEKALREAGLEP
jgi:acetolactate synthase-1/2/3 large subunit